MRPKIAIFVLLFISLILTTVSYAQNSVKLKYHYPHPYTKLNHLRLIPQTVVPQNCVSGSLMVNASLNNKIRYCPDDEWGAFPGVWASDGDQIFTSLPNPKVGIGTIFPTTTLHVTGEAHIRLEGESTALEFNDTSAEDGKFRFRCCDGDKLILESNVGTWVPNLTLQSNGHVGVGTTSPESVFHVKGNSILIEDTSTDIIFKPGNGNMREWKFTATNDKMHIGELNQKFLVIQDDGRVGIGTTTPEGHLHLKGSNNPGALTIQDSTTDEAGIEMRAGWSADFAFSAEAGELTISAHDTPSGGPSPSWVDIMLMNYQGFLGIGNLAPSSVVDILGDGLKVESSSDAIARLLNNNGGGFGYQLMASNVDFGFHIQQHPFSGTSQDTKFLLSESGQLTVGNNLSLPNSDLEIRQETYGSTSIRLVEHGTLTAIWNVSAYANTANDNFRINGGFTGSLDDRFIIAQNGFVGINQSNPAEALHVDGSIFATQDVCANNGLVCLFTYFPPSDAKLKKNITPIKNALEKIEKLEGVSFYFKKSQHKDLNRKKSTGLIAQDVEDIIPSWVHQYDDKGHKAINPQGFEALTVEALRELNTSIERIQERTNAVNNQLDEMEQSSKVSY